VYCRTMMLSCLETKEAYTRVADHAQEEAQKAQQRAEAFERSDAPNASLLAELNRRRFKRIKSEADYARQRAAESSRKHKLYERAYHRPWERTPEELETVP
jgi:hypothetical protein